MNIKEYISSGFVESYVLGLASEDERAEFEKLCAQHPELVEARTSFELLLEKAAMENAVEPPVNSKEKIWTALQQTPASNTPKIITMEPTTRRSSGSRWLAAASVILLLVAAYFAYNFSNENKKLKEANDNFKAEIDQKDSEINQRDSLLDLLKSPNVTMVNMTALKPSAPSVNVYWDSTSTNVYLVVRNLPKLANDKQYQLWSLIDSNGLKPTSLGLFDGGNEKVILKMNNAQKAESFAITIEPRGNTEGPHLDNLQNKGDIKKL